MYKFKAVFLSALMAMSFSLSSPGFAQVLSKSVPVDGTNVGITLRGYDHECRNEAPVALGKLFCVKVTAKTTDAVWLKDLKLEKFDAVMPAHRHGMVTRAQINQAGPGEYLIKGLKLHMAGEWEFKLSLLHGKSPAQVAIPMKL
jgi:hypothetical protein